jgi:peptide/nickel transport system substrate-binding protein
MIEGSHGNRAAVRRLTRRRWLRTAAAAGIGATALGVIACGGDEESASETPAGAAATTAGARAAPIRRGGAWRGGGNYQPAATDPYQTSDSGLYAVANMVFNRLYRNTMELPDDRTKPGSPMTVPELAEKMPEVIGDGTDVVITLREGVTFHAMPPANGRAFTAQDFVENYKRFVAEPRNPARGDYTSVIDSVQAPDNRTLRFKLKTPFSALANLLGHWSSGIVVMAPEVTDASKSWIGTGPFTFDFGKDYQAGVRWVVRANPIYWEQGADGKALPYLDQAEFLVIQDPNLLFSQFASGDLESYTAPADLIDQVKKQVPNAIQSRPLTYNQSLFFGFVEPQAFKQGERSFFADVRVRRALAQAIDYEALVETYFGKGNGYVWASIPGGMEPWYLEPKGDGYGNQGQFLTYNPDGAKRLLTEAGYDGHSIEFRYVSDAYGPIHVSAAEAVARMYGAAGLKIQLVPEPFTKFFTNTFVGKFPGGIAWTLEKPYDDPYFFYFNRYHPDGGKNHSLFNNPELNRRILALQTEQDEKKRVQLTHEFQRYEVENVLYLPGVNQIVRGHFVQGYARDYDNWGFSQTGTVLKRVWLEKKA